MDIKKNKGENSKQEMAGEESGGASATAQDLIERGAKAYGQAEQAVSHVYDKTTQAVNDNYKKARRYSIKNPDKTILVSLGIGAGLGFLLGASAHRVKETEDHNA
jgi:ElaB/YqjD/DUF883 family membrane-anchored ribosome-binding protein